MNVFWDLALYPLLAGLVGFSIGSVELFQRYKAEPLRAVFSLWGLLFSLFNGVVSAGAYLLLFTWSAGSDAMPVLEQLNLVATGGIGAAVVLRAKIFTARLADGQEVAVGPDYVVRTFLDVIDRKLDQARARARYDAVHELMKDIDFRKAKLKLSAQLYLAMQSVSEEEIAEFRRCVDELDRTDDAVMEPQEKSYNLGYYLLDLVGEEFLKHVVKEYRDELEVGPPSIPDRV